MKKLCLNLKKMKANYFFLLFLVGSVVFSQNKETKQRRNEIKTNFISNFFFHRSTLELSYQRILNRHHSLGAMGLINYYLINHPPRVGPFFGAIESKYALRGFYKYYFSNKKYAAGFFMKIIVGVVYDSIIDNGSFGNPKPPVHKTRIRRDVGLYLGYKFAIKNRFLIELRLGAPYLIGFSIGYRF